ncbi:hypothetical protein [Actinocorallia longicatena]|uniref:DUF485 domain-containing protein n=1 Tax=Actinocorallia longicatena TaxID=111803 RepID=A0ABP6QBR9_9ACTN
MSGGRQRVVVEHPRARQARVTRWSVARDIGEQTELGELFVRSLVRAQLRQALRAAGIVLVIVAGGPLLLAGVPGAARLRLLGLPASWLLLALCVQPVWIATAFWQVRRAERIEEEFARVVERS